MKKLRVVPLVVVCFLVVLLSFMAADSTYVWLLALLPAPLAGICALISWQHTPLKWQRSYQPDSPQEQRHTWRIFGICCALIVSTLWLDWPFRLSFTLSAPFLLSIARQAKVHGGTNTPQQALFFTIRKVTVQDGEACLWIELPNYDAGYVGYTLFAYGTPAEVRSTFPNHVVTNLNDQWTLVREFD